MTGLVLQPFDAIAITAMPLLQGMWHAIQALHTRQLACMQLRRCREGQRTYVDHGTVVAVEQEAARSHGRFGRIHILRLGAQQGNSLTVAFGQEAPARMTSPSVSLLPSSCTSRWLVSSCACQVYMCNGKGSSRRPSSFDQQRSS